jgi:hypothetical protein
MPLFEPVIKTVGLSVSGQAGVDKVSRKIVLINMVTVYFMILSLCSSMDVIESGR